MLVGAPDRIVEVVAGAQDPDRLVGVVLVENLVCELPCQRISRDATRRNASVRRTVVFSFSECNAPVFYIHVLAAPGLRHFDPSLSDGECRAVKVVSRRDAQQVQESRCQVGMGSDHVGGVVFRDAWSPNDERDVDVLLVAAGLSRLQTMLADVESIVAAVDDVGVVHDAVCVKTLEETVYQLVDGLEGAQSLAVKVVIECYVRLILLLQPEKPVRSRWLRITD